jgi:hypothetical protein
MQKVIEKIKQSRKKVQNQILEKIKSTNLDRYGVEFPFQNKEIVEKAHNTSRERYGKDFLKPIREEFLKNNNGSNPFVVYKGELLLA